MQATARLRQRPRPLGYGQLVGNQLQHLGTCTPTHVCDLPLERATQDSLQDSERHSTCRGTSALRCPSVVPSVEQTLAVQLPSSSGAMLLLQSRALRLQLRVTVIQLSLLQHTWDIPTHS